MFDPFRGSVRDLKHERPSVPICRIRTVLPQAADPAEAAGGWVAGSACSAGCRETSQHTGVLCWVWMSPVKR